MELDQQLNDIFSFYIKSIEFNEEQIDKALLDNSRFASRIDPTNNTGRFVKGYASLQEKDSDGETIIQNGLDISYYKSNGYLNFMHKNDPENIVGIPVEAYIDKKGFFTKGMLFKNNKIADGLWNLAKELNELGNPRQLGFSIEGKVVERSAINKSKIVKAKVTNVAVTHIPVLQSALVTIEEFSKSFVPPSYDQVVGYIMKDLSLQKDISALDSVGLQVGHARDAGDANASSGRALATESLESDNKKIIVRNPSDKDMDEKLFSAWKSMNDSRKALISIFKSRNPDASDVLLEKIIDLIYKSGSLDNFVTILSNSNILTK